MLLRISQDDPTPVSVQIVAGAILGIAAGRIREGEPLPSVRQLARDLLVNPNTVARAWQELERRGFAEARRGVGLFVTDEGARKARRFRERRVRERLGAALREAAEAGLSEGEILRIAEEILDSAGVPAGEGRRDG